MSSAGARRWSRQSVSSVNREGEQVEQDNRCPNGTEGCPGVGAGVLPCTDCFLEGLTEGSDD